MKFVVLFVFFFFTVSCQTDIDNAILLESYGFSEEQTAIFNKEALENAIQDAVYSSSQGEPKIIRVPCGVFQMENLNFEEDNITICGCSKPLLSETKDSILGGTIFEGASFRINNRKNIKLQKLGIDVSDFAKDAINSGVASVGYQGLILEDVICLGSGEGHGVVFTSGDDNEIINSDFIKFNHGFAFRCSDSEASNVFIQDCGVSGFIIKGVDSGGTVIEASRNNVTSVEIKSSTFGGTDAGRGIVLNALEANTICIDNKISNVSMDSVNWGITLSGLGTVEYNQISNIRMTRPNFGGLIINNNADLNTFSNINMRNVNGDGFENQGTGLNNDIYQSKFSGSGTDVLGSWRNSQVENN